MALDIVARAMAHEASANLNQYVEAFENGFKFVGISTTDPLVSGATVGSYNDWAAGDIVLYDDKKYLLVALPNAAENWMVDQNTATKEDVNNVRASVDLLEVLLTGHTQQISTINEKNATQDVAIQALQAQMGTVSNQLDAINGVVI